MGRHGNKGSLTQHPGLRERQGEERVKVLEPGDQTGSRERKECGRLNASITNTTTVLHSPRATDHNFPFSCTCQKTKYSTQNRFLLSRLYDARFVSPSLTISVCIHRCACIMPSLEQLSEALNGPFLENINKGGIF